MSVKDVNEYFVSVANDYKNLRETLTTLESEITEESSSNALKNIEQLRERANKVEANYMRISYIIFLLNKPNNKKKAKRYEESEKKRLNNIPKEAKLEAIKEENKEAINDINKMLKC